MTDPHGWRPRSAKFGEPGNGRYDAELPYANRLGDVRLVLLEKAPQHCSKPEFQPASYCCIRVVLVVAELVRELSSLHRERDRDDDATDGQAQTRSVDSDASRCRPPSTSAAVSTTVTPGRCA